MKDAELQLRGLRGAGMAVFFDRNDTRAPKSRELHLFRTLKTIIAVARPRSSGLRKLMRSADIEVIDSREALSRMPVLRRRDIEAMRLEEPPFGGLLAPRVGALRRVHTGAPQGHARDWWSCARALAAAGAVKGDIVLNCFSYHLADAGFMVEDGAAEIGCCVIPAGAARADAVLREVHAFKPSIYCGGAEHLLRLLDHAATSNFDASSIRSALVFDNHVPRPLRAEIEARGVKLRQAYVTAEHGVIAYEADPPDGDRGEGLFVNEGVVLEIVRPGTSERVVDGEVGEVVVTRVNNDYPLVRVSTGDLSRVVPGRSPCGRTATRIAGWLGRAAEVTQVVDRTLTPSHALEVAARHAGVRRLQIRVERRDGRDAVLLRAEGSKSDPQLPINLKRDLFDVAGVDGEIEVVGPGVLDEAPLILDARGKAI